MWTVRRTSVSNIVHKFTNKLKWCQLKQCSYLEIVKIPNRQPHVDSYEINVLSCTDFYVVKISGYIYHPPKTMHSSSATCFKIFKTWSYRQNYKSHLCFWLLCPCLLTQKQIRFYSFLQTWRPRCCCKAICSPFRWSPDLYHGTYKKENRFR